jgi:GNAT superfamily N-acetyltransferase
VTVPAHLFRRATNRDRAIAQRIVDDALRAHGLHIVLEHGDVDLTDLEAHYDDRGGRFELIEGPTGDALGVVGWRLAPGQRDVLELKKLYLTEAARGVGLGRRAVERVIAEARALGCRSIVLETARILERANQLYRQIGFLSVSGEAAGPFAALADQCDLAYRLEL